MMMNLVVGSVVVFMPIAIVAFDAFEHVMPVPMPPMHLDTFAHKLAERGARQHCGLPSVDNLPPACDVKPGSECSPVLQRRIYMKRPSIDRAVCATCGLH